MSVTSRFVSVLLCLGLMATSGAPSAFAAPPPTPESERQVDLSAQKSGIVDATPAAPQLCPLPSKLAHATPAALVKSSSSVAVPLGAATQSADGIVPVEAKAAGTRLCDASDLGPSLAQAISKATFDRMRSGRQISPKLRQSHALKPGAKILQGWTPLKNAVIPKGPITTPAKKSTPSPAVASGKPTPAPSTGQPGPQPQAPDFKLSGTLTSPSAIPAEGVTVDIYDFNWSWMAVATTIDDGKFSFSLPAGSYYLTFTSGAHVYATGYRGLTGFTYYDWEAVPVALAGDLTVDTVIPLRSEINGTVTDAATDLPVADAAVYLYDGDGYFYSDTSTIADGTYEIEVVPGDYLVEFAATGYGSGFYSDAGFVYSVASATVLSPNQTSVKANIELPAALYLSGKVSDDTAAHNPLQGIEVDLYDLTGNFYSYAYTEADGTFSIQVSPLSYKIYFYDWNSVYAGGYYRSDGFTYSWDDAEPVAIVDASVAVTISLPQALTISGRVTRSGGTGLGGIDVWANSTDDFFYASTEPDGTYTIAVAPGSYTLQFSDPTSQYETGWYSSTGFTYDSYAATPVTVVATNITGKNVTLPLTLHVRGRISGGGHGLDAIQIAVFSTDGRYLSVTMTSPSGDYSAAAVPGTYMIEATDLSGVYGSGYFASGAAGNFAYSEAFATTVTVSTADVTGRNMTLPTAVHIVGRVTNISAAGLSNISVLAMVGDYVQFSTTSLDGDYSLPVAPGTYTVYFSDGTIYASGYHSAGGFTYDSEEAAGVAVASADVTVDVVLPIALHISGQVTNPAHEGIAGVEVRAESGDHWYRTTTTDEDGNYVLAVSPGVYELSFTADTYASGYMGPTGFTYDPLKAEAIMVNVGDMVRNVELPYALWLSGRVSGGGNGLNGIQVSVSSIDGTYYNSSITDPDGNYGIAVIPGNYVVSFFDNNGVWAFGFYATGGFVYYYSEADTVTVAGNVNNIDVVLPAGLHIEGKVTRSGAIPVSDVYVTAISDHGTISTTTALDGTYSLVVAPDTYVVRFRDYHDRHPTGYYSTGGFTYSRASATPVVVTDADVTGKNVTLPAALTIKGKVTRVGGGGVPWVYVVAQSSAGTFTVQGKADGSYSIAVVPGSYTLYFEDPYSTYASGYYSTGGFTYYSSSASQVTVSTASVTGKNVTLPLAVFIKGKVTDTGSFPLSGINVFTYDSTGTMLNSAVSRADGTYSVAAAPGSYLIEFEDNSGIFSEGWRGPTGFVYFRDQAAAVAVSSATVTGQNVQLPRALYVKGRITDDHGSPIRKVEVLALRSDGRVAGSDGSRSDGTYRVQVPPGDYRIWVRDHYYGNGSGYYNGGTMAYTESAAVVINIDSADVEGANISMYPATNLVFPASSYTAIPPRRVLDTRATSGSNPINIGLSGPFVAGTVRTFQVAGAKYVGGMQSEDWWLQAIPWNATAVTGNVTIVGETTSGLVALGPTMAPVGDVTTINFVKGDTRANNVTVGLAEDGTLSAVFRSATAGATTHLIFDITGYFMPGKTGATYHAVPPGRVLDTRATGSGHTNIGLSGAFANRVVRTFNVAGIVGLGWASAQVPSSAIAVTGNVTVTNATSLGYVAIGPTMTTNPSTSTLNVAAGVNRANGITVALKNGKLQAVWAGATGSKADVIFDVTGYFTADMTGLAYYPINPFRALDSSLDLGLSGPFTNRTPQTMAVAGLGSVPADAAGISGNLTLVNPSSVGYAFISPEVVAVPTSSTVNAPAHQNVANGFDLPLSAGGLALIWCGTTGSTADMQLDITGYWK